MTGPLGNGAKRLSELASIGAGWALLCLSFAITFEILARKLFNVSLQGVDELGGYVLAISSALGFSYALATDSHIRIDMLLVRMSKRAQAVALLPAFALLSAFAGILAWRSIAVTLESWSLNAVAPTPLKTPLAIPQAIWSVALCAFLLACLVATFRLLIRLTYSGRDGAPYSTSALRTQTDD